VGKGIVYDTGGLSIKSKTGMPGMKRDCGGAAAVLAAFYVAVRNGFKGKCIKNMNEKFVDYFLCLHDYLLKCSRNSLLICRSVDFLWKIHAYLKRNPPFPACMFRRRRCCRVAGSSCHFLPPALQSARVAGEGGSIDGLLRQLSSCSKSVTLEWLAIG
jgi:hypothetical protein